jgi:hypothetical protein
VKRNCRPHKHGILIELFDLNTAFTIPVAQRVSVLVSCCEHYGKFLSVMVFKLPQYSVLIQHDFEIMICNADVIFGKCKS